MIRNRSATSVPWWPCAKKVSTLKASQSFSLGSRLLLFPIPDTPSPGSAGGLLLGLCGQLGDYRPLLLLLIFLGRCWRLVVHIFRFINPAHTHRQHNDCQGQKDPLADRRRKTYQLFPAMLIPPSAAFLYNAAAFLISFLHPTPCV